MNFVAILKKCALGALPMVCGSKEYDLPPLANKSIPYPSKIWTHSSTNSVAMANRILF